MDRFHELTAFITVVEAGGFSAAARRLGESQSAMSKSISAMEKRLGVMLFNRSTRNVTPTEQGRRYYEQTKPLLEELDEADAELNCTAPEASGLVRIAASATFGRLHVLPLIPRILLLYPKIELDIRLSDSVSDLIKDGIDLEIKAGPVRDSNTVVKRLASSPLVCIGSHQYFDEHGTPSVPEDLASHNCLIYKDMTSWQFTGPKGKFTVPVQGNLSSDSVETILTGVLADVGIGMLHRDLLVGEYRHPNVMTILDQYINGPRDISFICPEHRFMPSRVRGVIDFFATAFAQRF